MDEPQNSQWRQMLTRGRQEYRPLDAASGGQPASPLPSTGYDDGYDPAQRGLLSPLAVTNEAVAALADSSGEYRPWISQRGRTRPSLMLHLRRFDPRAGLWQGWQVSYAHLVAVEYVGDAALSLDFGARQFMLEGREFGELISHLQSGTVLCIQQYAASVWPTLLPGPSITSIKLVIQSNP